MFSWEIVALAAMKQRDPELLLVHSDINVSTAVMGLLCSDLAVRGYCTQTELDVNLSGYSLTQQGIDELLPEVVASIVGPFVTMTIDKTPTQRPDKEKAADLENNKSITLSASGLNITGQLIGSTPAVDVIVDIGLGLGKVGP